ncbi:hypothetical protein SD70_04445 [Gordoniibacillus kamchatkensis]|uniref:Methyltransferase domain-containing protein n=1 Tax=Gordoniibacillus kamchatkensis TaxID=1590651 RepID=A0ABR5ALG4_9BACL|nr:methyltransferase domain-containing protein [Paenibacillus sp. VKM B-2647]KIL41869.1 hypothetical protein SD70_04445 [Paenibacillus sp. VKM B-2647]
MANNEIMICPVCHQGLKVNGNSYVCSNKHTFDIASKGYVNLLLSHQKNSKEPGDNKQMVLARNAFLNTGYYQRLSETINGIVVDYMKSGKQLKSANILDAGCGEGYYSDSLDKALKTDGIEANLFGIDISKDAVKLAATRNKTICFAIASTYHIPIAANTIDCLLQLFSPYSNHEFDRVMKKDSILISVIPGQHHLFGLKKLLYENPYANDEQEHPLVSFEPIGKLQLQYDIVIEDAETIKNLLMMTPYYWRTNLQKIQKLYEIDRLETPVDFVITTYAKKR